MPRFFAPVFRGSSRHLPMLRTALLAAMVLAAELASSAAAGTTEGKGKKKPHIVYILADDFGFAGADWHKGATANATGEMATPFLSSLLAGGVELDRMSSSYLRHPSVSL